MVRIVPILRPQEAGKEIRDLSAGVGTPNVLFNSDTGERYLLFTGWRDLNGLKREGWIAPLEKDLSVDLTRARKILPSDLIPGDYTMNAVRGVYNPVRGQYIVTVTHDDKGFMFWFSSDWELMAHKQILSGIGDHGIPFKPIGAYDFIHDAIGMIPAPLSKQGPAILQGLKFLGIRNFDDPKKVRVEDYGWCSWHGMLNDVADLVLMPRISALVECDTFGKWALKIFLGPSLHAVRGLDPRSGIPQIGLLCGDLMPKLMIDDIFVQVGHPHYTTEPDGVPKVFFASFRDTWSSRNDTKREGYVHEIYAVYVNDDIFDARSYGVLTDTIISKERGETCSKWYWVGEARSILLLIRGSVKRADIVVKEATMLLEVEAHETIRYEITEDKRKIIVQDPAPLIRVETSSKGLDVELVAKY
ncbi:MAG: hypothetical protein J7L11_07920 [Thermoprotei archaeon]|nr:hypothetical protein [Thermoprotei archaeon]